MNERDLRRQDDLTPWMTVLHACVLHPHVDYDIAANGGQHMAHVISATYIANGHIKRLMKKAHDAYPMGGAQ